MIIKNKSESCSYFYSESWLSRLPFGRDVLLLSGEGSEAMVREEGGAVLPGEDFDGLAPPAGVSVAGALQHQRPEQNRTERANSEPTGGLMGVTAYVRFLCFKSQS